MLDCTLDNMSTVLLVCIPSTTVPNVISLNLCFTVSKDRIPLRKST